MNSNQNERVYRSPLHKMIGGLHNRLVYQRRIRAIMDVLVPMLPAGLLLDVGCGNGNQASYLMSIRPDIEVIGLEVFLRLEAAIPIISYNGVSFPFRDHAFSSVIISDTLHHLKNQKSILSECLRVSRHSVFIKDHFYRNRWELLLLRLLDFGGNAAHGVPSIFNYFKRDEWERLLSSVGAVETFRLEHIPGQYPKPLQSLIGQKIQFVSRIALWH